MVTKTKKKRTLNNMVVLDPVAKHFTQKDHIVYGEKVLEHSFGKCLNCSEDFPKKRIDQVFCSTTCRIEWHDKNVKEREKADLSPRECSICGSIFAPERKWSVYCSEGCRKESKRRKLKEKYHAVLV